MVGLGTSTDLDEFMRIRAATDGSDVAVWFAGEIHAWLPGEPARHLFGFEGVNVARAVAADGGWDLLSREAVYYLDPETREVLDAWKNPFTNEDVEVVHVQNDPVNFPLRDDGPRGPFRVATTDLGDRVAYTSDVYLTYPSPLPRAEYPQHSQSDLYQAAELFQYVCAKQALASGAASVPADVSWTRIAPWVPFMAMADRPGHLVYHCMGTKLPGGAADLPARIRDHIERTAPQFLTAPREVTGPNETSWTHFKRLLDSRQGVG